MGGATVIIYPRWVFYDYAGLHIMAVQSMVSHTLMIIISISLLFISNHWEKETNIRKPLTGFCFIAVIALTMSKLLNTNYMLMLNADSIPILKNFPYPWYWLIAIPLLIIFTYIVKFMFQSISKRISSRKTVIMLQYNSESFGVIEIVEEN
jgi:uncharacterized membrane protein YwaF